MSSVLSLRDHLVEELNDLLSAEHQLIEALPQMQQKASQRQLKAAFRSHLAETRGQARRVQQALKMLGEQPSEKTCEAMEGLLTEGQELMESSDAGALRDAMMITAAQKVEHYEIATYGTVQTYAQILGEKGVARLLAQTLKEEKAADKKLTVIAVGSVNRRAATEWHEQESMAEMLRKQAGDVQKSANNMLQKSAAWLGSTVGTTVKTARRLMPSAAADRKSRTKSGRRSPAVRGRKSTSKKR
jgi:ferritin-like metal-binding protein YciE